MQTIIATIFILLNIFSFGLYAYDKIAAQSGWWQVRERTLLTVSVLGGCFGGTLAMYLLRHKTQHTRFILVNWIADAVYLVILLVLLRQWADSPGLLFRSITQPSGTSGSHASTTKSAAIS